MLLIFTGLTYATSFLIQIACFFLVMDSWGYVPAVAIFFVLLFSGYIVRPIAVAPASILYQDPRRGAMAIAGGRFRRKYCSRFGCMLDCLAARHSTLRALVSARAYRSWSVYDPDAALRHQGEDD